MPTTIESLELEISQNSGSAVSGIDALSNALCRLRAATKGGVGLRTVANQVRDANTALSGVDGSSADKISRLADALDKLKNLGSFKLSASIANQLKNISSAVSGLSTANFSGVSNLATALAPLQSITNSTGLQSVIKQLRDIPALANTLNGVNWSQFTTQIQNLADALVPLVNRLNSLSVAFSGLPNDFQRLIRSTDTLTRANERASRSYTNLWSMVNLMRSAVRGSARVFAGWITQANKYIEDLNLFNVALGEYAVEAKQYAEQVSELLGIDPADWMRNQGVFNTIIRGFGVASDKAYLMSKNLTQLGYDISSFYNISVDEAMKKLGSGIAGELEPLRRIGYDLSVARLQQEAYNLGITKSITKMTQAEKSQLRYYAILTQVKDAQGDMARTLNAPANQLRVLQAQVTQLSRALGQIFIPAINAVLPYLIALAKGIRLVAESIAGLLHVELPKVDYSGVTDVADATQDIGEEAGKATQKVKKLKKSIMSFDELNLLNGRDKDDGKLSSLTDGLGGAIDVPLPEYDFLKGLVDQKVDDIINTIKAALWEITAIISGFALAIGTILVVTGTNIPVGLALMAIGAAGLVAAVVANWNSMSTRLAKVLTVITGVLGGFLLALGAFLVFSGTNVPLGAGLMIAGAVSLATAATINWKFLEGDLKNALSILTGIVAGATLALGAFFLLTGISPTVGAGLLFVGAANLVTAIALNWDALTEPVKRAISIIEAIAGGALLALGVILAFGGVSKPLGVALIAAGAISIVSAVALNWDSLISDIKARIGILTGIVSGAMLGIGAILVFTGVYLPLGIALITAGAVGIVSVASLNWDLIVSAIKGVLKAIGITLGGMLLPIGAVLAFSGVALPLGIALIAVGAASFVSSIALNWSTLTNKVKGLLTAITSIVSVALLALGAIVLLTGNLPLGIALIAAGAVGLVTAVALNFNAVINAVGSFFKTIARLFTGVALVALGLLLCATMIGLPLGLGLIAAGATALEKPQSFNVKSLVNIGKQTILGLQKGVSEAWSKFLDYWKGIFDGAVTWVKNFLGIHSPSTVFLNIGKYMVAGLSNGLAGISGVFSSVFQTIGKWLGSFGSNMFKWGSEMMGNLVSGINSGLRSLAQKVADAASTIRSYLHFSQPDIGPLADFNTWMPDMMNQLAGGIADHEDVVQRQIAKLAGDMNLESSIQANVSAYGAKATVSNGGDIDSSGLSSAIYNAVVSALSAQNESEDGGTPIIINIGNEQFASFMVKQNKRVALISGGRA